MPDARTQHPHEPICLVLQKYTATSTSGAGTSGGAIVRARLPGCTQDSPSVLLRDPESYSSRASHTDQSLVLTLTPYAAVLSELSKRFLAVEEAAGEPGGALGLRLKELGDELKALQRSAGGQEDLHFIAQLALQTTRT